jgi:hypothetical protein
VARVHEEEVFLVIACCKIMLIFWQNWQSAKLIKYFNHFGG